MYRHMQASSETVARALGPIGIAQRKATIRKDVDTAEETRVSLDGSCLPGSRASVFSTSLGEAGGDDR